MYIHVSFDSSSELYNENQPDDFIYELPMELYLPGKWVLGVHEVIFKTELKQNTYIYCDIIEHSIVNGELRPLLRVVRRPVNQSPIFYVPVIVTHLKRFKITLRTKTDSIPNLPTGGLLFVLELKQNNNTCSVCDCSNHSLVNNQ